jgi:frataxin
MTELDEGQFARLADDALGRLFEQLEEAVGDNADVELQEGILTVDFDNGGHFVLNKHQPNRQIWLASSVSGAAHFRWDGNEWISTRDGARLRDVLSADISKLADVVVDLSY